jgi:signal transduction histidine kinase
VYVIVALLGAAVLVLYLDHQSVASHERQYHLLRHEIFDHVASNVVAEIRSTFEGPVFDTLAAVNHPVLKTGRLDVVAAQFTEGLRKYPQVQSFFVWNSAVGPLRPAEILFFDRKSASMQPPVSTGTDRSRSAAPDPQVLRQTLAAFRRDPEIAALIEQGAARHAASQQIYFAMERAVRESRYDIFVRLFWVDANRDRYFAMLGFVVDLEDVHTTLFPELFTQRLAALLRREGDLPGLELRVLDEADRVVFGPPPPLSQYEGEARFALQFYPAEAIRTRTSVGITERTWRVTISQARNDAQHAGWMGPPRYLLSGLSVVLMLVALALVVQGNRRAGQLSRMQADFVSHVSHQLKTPLSLLSAVCETLGLDRVHSPEKLHQYLGIIRSETARLSALVERILEYSRVDGGGRRYELEPLDLVSLVYETVDAFARPLGDSAEIRVEETGGRPIVAADAAALEQVLANLLDNALKYSGPQKRVLVRVGCDGGDATIAVVDQGIGIDIPDQRRIFEKFYRGAGAAHSRDGFGLGLAIVRQLVTAHDGTIEVSSSPGQGSTFTITLPGLSESARETTLAQQETADAQRMA